MVPLKGFPFRKCPIKEIIRLQSINFGISISDGVVGKQQNKADKDLNVCFGTTLHHFATIHELIGLFLEPR